MNHVLLWKEYRQQRAIWLAVAFLGIFLVLLLGLALGQGSGLEAFRDGSIRPTLIIIILALGVTYGIVSGALLLAGEKEDRTLDFLDGLSGQRGPVWRRKATAGALFTLAQAIVMSVLLAGLGLGSWRTALVVFYWCLDGLAWGLLGGSLCNKVLTAVLAGIAFMGSTWLLVLFVESFTALYLGKAMLAGAGVLYSRKMFCQDDPTRQSASRKSRFTKLIPASWRVLVWLSFRQGRWVLAGALAFAIALGLTVNLAPLILWPIGTLLLGLTCGLATFCPDQGDGGRFLGAQRFSPGKIWTMKVLFWATSAVLLTALAWATAMSIRYQLFPEVFSRSSHESWVNAWIPWQWTISPLMFLGFCPLYGFFCGQFVGLVMPRPVLAVILSVFITPFLVAIWLPSLVVGGVPIWQLLIVPGLLVLTTRLAIWPWISGRLMSAKPLLSIIGAVALMLLSVAGSLGYRAIEVPDVGEPFDVKAYLAGLPSPENNEAGPLIRNAFKAMKEHKEKVEEKLKPPARFASERYGFRHLLGEIFEKGWPQKDQEISPWLDQIFQGDWVKMARKAAQLPLGMVVDPRQANVWSAGYHNDCETMSRLLAIRALQLQAKGESAKALDLLNTALGLSRQMRNHTGNYLYGSYFESAALVGLHDWLEKVGPNKKLLQKALTMLQNHAAKSPDPADTIKAEYLAALNSLPPNIYTTRKVLVHQLTDYAFQVPWEKQRNERVLQAIFKAQIDQAKMPLWEIESLGEIKKKYAGLDRDTQSALVAGLPLKEGPGSAISAERWGEFIRHSWGRAFVFSLWPVVKHDLQRLRATQLVTALAFYQSDNGKPPANLDDLVPNYLPKLPIDPATGKSFGYRISKGEEINGYFPNGSEVNRRLAPGQALVWSEGPREYKFPVPVWKKGAGP
jgi:hypothetical protein